MNTTIQAQITNDFINQFGQEQFFTIIEAFRNKARTTGLTALEHILYNKVRNLPLKRGFTQITNTTKLANGLDPYDGFKWNLGDLNSLLRYKNNNFEAVFKINKDMQQFLLN